MDVYETREKASARAEWKKKKLNTKERKRLEIENKICLK